MGYVPILSSQEVYFLARLPKGAAHSSPKVKRKLKEPGPNQRGRYQYIRMELCDSGDAEEYLKEQPNEALLPNEARRMMFQIYFALHATADRFSLKHCDWETTTNRRGGEPGGRAFFASMLWLGYCKSSNLSLLLG